MAAAVSTIGARTDLGRELLPSEDTAASAAGYTAANGAVENLSRELGLEYAQSDIQALCPGFAVHKFGEQGCPDFVVTVSAFTPNAATDFLTGQCLIVDGGCMAK